MPATIPALLSTSTNGFPAAVDWYSVSSNMMQPEMASLRPGAVYSSSRQSRRLVSVFSASARRPGPQSQV